MAEKIIFHEKQKLAIPITCAFLVLMSLFFLNLGAFTISVECANRTCTTDMTSLFSIVRTTHTIRDVSIVDVPTRRSSKGGLVSNVVFGNGYESARVWSMDSNMNRDLQAEVAIWLRKGAAGESVSEARQDWNFNLIMSFLLLIFAYSLHYTEKKNRLNPATIIMDEHLLTLIDLGGKTMRFGIEDIEFVTVANTEEIIKQRSPRFYKMGGLKLANKKTKEARGILFETRMGRTFVVSNHSMNDTDVHMAIHQIKKYIDNHRRIALEAEAEAI